MVLAQSEGNGLAEGRFEQDMLTLPADILDSRYGKGTSDQRAQIFAARDQQVSTKEASRSFGQIIGDTSLAAATGLVGTVGGLSSATLAAGGAVDQVFNEDNTGLSEAAAYVQGKTNQASDWLSGFKSTEIQDRLELSEIEKGLDEEDSLAQYIEEGDTSLLAKTRRVGRDVLCII